MRIPYYVIILFFFLVYLYGDVLDILKLKEDTLFIKNKIYLYKSENKTLPKFLNKDDINREVLFKYKKINKNDFLLITKTDSSRCSVDSRNIIRCEIIL